jgi:hypothetical protein
MISVSWPLAIGERYRISRVIDCLDEHGMTNHLTIGEFERLRRERQAYTIAEFSEAFRVNRTKIWEEMRDGRLRGRRLGKRVLTTTMTATNAKIIEIAKLMLRANVDEEVREVLEAESNRLGNNQADHAMLQVAYKILSGKRYSVSTGDLGLIERCRSLAKDLNATVEDGADGLLSHAIDPSGRTAAARMAITIMPPKEDKPPGDDAA